MELDRPDIERRDFPIARRGYDPAAVDAHLRALAERAQELAERAAAAAEPSLGTAAATQVQGILEAAQATAAEIAREAQRDAQRTREEAAREVERARTHVETLARASTALLAHVESLDGEVSALAQGLRAGEGVSRSEEQRSAPRPVSPPAATVAEGGRDLAPSAPPPTPATAPAPALASAGSVPPPTSAAAPAPAPALASAGSAPPPTSATAPAPPLAPAPEAAPQAAASERGSDELDGARLVALNMALGGEPREQTDRYLAESFQLADRAKLLDEVYAAVEG